MRDIDIRNIMKKNLLQEHIQDSDTLVIDEFDLALGEVRVDIAVINGKLNGYEIKSEQDNLERLPKQVEYYSKILDQCYLIINEKHYSKAMGIIPNNWGIYVVIENDLVNYRDAINNEYIDLYSLALLLWRDEAVSFVRKIMGTDKKMSSMTRLKAAKFISENCNLEELNSYVRACLKKRTNWRVDSQ